MARTDYITNGNFRLQVYQSDIINPTSSDPYVNVTVYLQAYSNGNGITYPTDDVISFVSMSGSLLNGAYTYSGSVNDVGNWSSGWKTIATIFYQKGIWSVSRTRTSFNVSLSGTCYVYPESGYRRTYSISLSGTVSMAAWPVSGTKDTMSVASSMTMGSSYTVSITHKTSGNKNTLTWKFGSQTGTLLSSSTATSVTFSPSTSLGSQIPSANSGTVTFTLTTYNSSGVNLGSTTYTSTLSVPSYSLSAPTVSAAKNTYTGVGAFVANRTKTRFTLSGLPSGSYGATVTGSYVIKLGTVQQTSGTKTGTSSSNVDYTASAAGTLQLTYTIRDSRGKTASASASVTYVANQAPTLNFAADRDPDTPTTWLGAVSGTFLNVTGNTVSVTYSSGTGTAPTAASGSYSGGTVVGTGLAETSSLNVTATVTDSLGNTASKSVRISTVFAYIEATPSHVLAFGRKASTNLSNRIQVGLPMYLDETVDVTGASFLGDIYPGRQSSKKIAAFVYEQGTSNSWKYRKWSDGFCEMWYTRTVSSVSCTSSFGSMYYGLISTLDYPFAFTAVPSEQITVKDGSASVWLGSYDVNTTNKSARPMAIRPTSGTVGDLILHYYVAGYIA